MREGEYTQTEKNIVYKLDEGEMNMSKKWHAFILEKFDEQKLPATVLAIL